MKSRRKRIEKVSLVRDPRYGACSESSPRWRGHADRGPNQEEVALPMAGWNPMDRGEALRRSYG